jgi:hypothetical protein
MNILSEKHYDGCWRAHHDCAIAEIERLHEALPRTKDGVAVVPGMKLWYRHPKGKVYERQGAHMFDETFHYDTEGNRVWIGVEDCYSSREAAESGE